MEIVVGWDAIPSLPTHQTSKKHHKHQRWKQRRWHLLQPISVILATWQS